MTLNRLWKARSCRAPGRTQNVYWIHNIHNMFICVLINNNNDTTITTTTTKNNDNNIIYNDNNDHTNIYIYTSSKNKLSLEMHN